MPFGSVKRIAMGVEQTHCTALALFSLELPLMSNAAANSIFTCEEQLNLFMRMYLARRHSNGAGASQPSASGPPLLAPPPMRSMSAKNLCAKSPQALLGTDDGASQRGNPTKASEQSQRSRRVMRPTDKRNLWPGLWRLMPEWREIVIQNNGVSKFFGSDAQE